jgi:hypothetical protein
MPRSGVVGLLVLALVLNGCASPSRVSRSAGPPDDAVIVMDQPPRQAEHPVRDWCKAHPVTTGTVVGVLVVGAVLGSLGAMMAVVSSDIH